MIIRAILGSLLAVSFGAICFGAGVFTESFNENMCYSKVLASVGAGTQTAANSSDPDQFKKWAAFVSNLPLSGYESDCEQILAHIKLGTKHEY